MWLGFLNNKIVKNTFKLNDCIKIKTKTIFINKIEKKIIILIDRKFEYYMKLNGYYQLNLKLNLAIIIVKTALIYLIIKIFSENK